MWRVARLDQKKHGLLPPREAQGKTSLLEQRLELE